MTFSIIQKSQLENAKRMDAEFFHPEKLQALNILNKLEGEKLANYFFSSKKIFNPSTQKLKTEATVYDLTDALGLFLGSGKVASNSGDIGSSKKIVEKNDIIISRLRSYLKEIAFVLNNKKAKFVSTEFIVLRSKKCKIYPELLFTFLQTNIVQKILEWSQEGVNHPRFSENTLLNLKFPTVLIKKQGIIRKLVADAYRSYAHSKDLYQQAEDLLLEELGLKNFEVEESLSSVVNLSEVKTARRMDAEYFQPKYKKLVEKVENYKNGFDVVKNIVSWKKGIEVGSEAYQETGKDFIRVSDFSINGIEKSNKKISERLFEEIKKDFQPKKGEMLFTKDGTIGMSHVLKDDIEGILSGAFLRLRLEEKYKNFEKEYLTLIFNSILCKSQVEKLSGGAIIAHLKPSDFEKFKIPLIKPEIQKQIAELVQKSHISRKKAKKLLEEAKRKVEEMIEKGGGKNEL